MKWVFPHVWSGDNNLFFQHSTLAMVWPHGEDQSVSSKVAKTNVEK